MAEPEVDDPFGWDVERVVQELCTENRTWQPTARAQLPDQKTLAEKLMENEYDGEVLLTSLDDMSNLWSDLGITKPKFRMAIRTAIQQFRKRSPMYKKYRRSLATDSDLEMTPKREKRSLSPGPSSVTLLPGSVVADNGPTPQILSAMEPHKAGDDNGQDKAERGSDEPFKKKRRLAPTQLTTNETPRDKRFSDAPIATEADTIKTPGLGARSVAKPTGVTSKDIKGVLQADWTQQSLLSPSGAYWGNGKLSQDEIISADTASDEGTFSWSQPKLFGRAKKQYVNGQIKRYLRDPERFKETNNEDDTVLGPLGESDNDDNPEWLEIEREIELEQEEVRLEKERALAKPLQLRPDEVSACLDEIVNELITRWSNLKLPKLQREAFTLWSKARRFGNRNSQVIQLTNDRRESDARLMRLLENLKDNVYTNQKELRNMAPVLEPTVYKLEELKYRIGILKQRDAPEEMASVKRPKRVPKDKRPVDPSDDGIDLWSEDDLDGFIEDDGAGGDGNGDPEEDLDELGSQAMSMDASAEDSDEVVNDATGSATPAAGDPAQSFASTSSDGISIHDLTQVSGTSREPISLVTPVKSKRIATASPASSQKEKLESLSDWHNIRRKGPFYYMKKESRDHTLVAMLAHCPPKTQIQLTNAIKMSEKPEDLWKDIFAVAIKDVREGTNNQRPADEGWYPAPVLARLFDIYRDFDSYVIHPASHRADPEEIRKVAVKPFSKIDADDVEKYKDHFDTFYTTLRRLGSIRGFCEPYQPESALGGEADLGGGGENQGVDPWEQTDAADWQETPDMTPIQKSEARRKRREAQSARIRREDESNSQHIEARKLIFRQRLEESTLVPKEKSRLIINESKEEGEGLIYIHKQIAPKIKDYQVEGVRFMWDAITKKGQGCLLAHTMGLGKTMQVITLLTAIASASQSKDETIISQIPRHLRDVKYLVLCPAGILDNWVNEITTWAPRDILKDVYYFQSKDNVVQRATTIRQWADQGGVLVLGYPMFRNIDQQEEGQDLRQILLNAPTLVVADEAHNFKNASSKLGMLCDKFKTLSRIAMTGSPLSNNVQEYYSTINWVSPGFLGDNDEFAREYSKPINEGLWMGVELCQRRRALIRLKALKATVAPKMHRKTLASLKGTLPPKKEYIIYLDLTELQREVYQRYVGTVRDQEGLNVTNAWSLVAWMTYLLAHPTLLLENRQRRLQNGKAQSSGNSKNTGPEPSAAVLATVDELFEKHEHKALEASNKMLVLDKILEEAGRVGDNVLVFSQSLDTLEFIRRHLCEAKNRAYKQITGSVQAHKRQAMVDHFNKHKPQVFLISTTAGSVGMNIHGANRVVIFDSKWNPSNEQQAIGRAYRFGQTKPVFVYWLVCDGTIEKTMQNQQIFKNQLSSRVVDSKAPVPKADNSINVWFRDYKQAEHKDKSGFRGDDPIMDAILESDLIRAISSIETTETFEEEENEDLPDAAAHNETKALIKSFTSRAKAPRQTGQVRKPPVLTSHSAQTSSHLQNSVPEVRSSTVNEQKPNEEAQADARVEAGKPEADDPAFGGYDASTFQGHRGFSQPPGTQIAPEWDLTAEAMPEGSPRTKPLHQQFPCPPRQSFRHQAPADAHTQAPQDIFSSIPTVQPAAGQAPLGMPGVRPMHPAAASPSPFGMPGVQPMHPAAASPSPFGMPGTQATGSLRNYPGNNPMHSAYALPQQPQQPSMQLRQPTTPQVNAPWPMRQGTNPTQQQTWFPHAVYSAGSSSGNIRADGPIANGTQHSDLRLRPSTSPAHMPPTQPTVPPVQWTGEASRPVMMGNAEGPNGSSRQSKDEREVAQIKGELKARLSTAQFQALERVISKMDPHVRKMGGLEKRSLWKKIKEVVKTNAEHLDKMTRLSGQELLRFLTSANVDDLDNAVSGSEPKQQDPDVGAPSS